MKAKKISALFAVCAIGLVSLYGCGGRGSGNNVQTIQLEDGSEYVGIVADGKPNGEGTLTNLLGSEWKGTFKDGKLQGYGTYLGYDLVEYEGFFADGEFSGYGHQSGANGDEYWGMFEKGAKNGVGRMEYTTGCVYEGGWVDGFMHGMGWMTWPVGDAYFGEWKNGNPQGFGCKIFYDAAFSVKNDYSTYNKYVGNMENNFPDGWGIMYFQESGGVYVGDWDTGIRSDEHGVYYFESGSEFVKFEGAFSKEKNSGWIWGEGTMWYADGRVVTGIWENTTCVEEKTEQTLSNVSVVYEEAESQRADFLSNPLLLQTMEKTK